MPPDFSIDAMVIDEIEAGLASIFFSSYVSRTLHGFQPSFPTTGNVVLLFRVSKLDGAPTTATTPTPDVIRRRPTAGTSRRPHSRASRSGLYRP